MLFITSGIVIPNSEIEMTAIRAQGAGGQHVNKTSTAIHLRFNIQQSSLPGIYKIRLLQSNDYRVSSDGIVIIKAQRYRSQERNKEDALQRLARFIKKVNTLPEKRVKTKPSKTSIRKRLDSKIKHGKLKKLRRLSLE